MGILLFQRDRNDFLEFDIEMDSVDATVSNRESDGLYSVNVIQKPNIVVAKGIGSTDIEAAERAIRIAELLNKGGI